MTKRTLGIHLEDYRIICVEAKVKNSVVVEKIATTELPRGIVTDGIIVEPASIVEILTEMLSKIEVSTDRAIVNIPSNLVQIKCIPTEKDYITIADDQLSWEISQHHNESILDFEVSHYTFPTTTILVGARRAALAGRAQVLEHAGLLVTSADPDPIAVFNLISLTTSSKTPINTMIIDVQTPFSQIVLSAKNEFGYGGSFFTPPELFGYGSGQRTWREFGEDLLASTKMVIKSLETVNPIFMPEAVLFTGRPLKGDIAQSLAAKLELKLLDFVSMTKRKSKVKSKKHGLAPTELSVVLGLAAHRVVRN